MNRPPLEVANIIRVEGDGFIENKPVWRTGRS